MPATATKPLTQLGTKLIMLIGEHGPCVYNVLHPDLPDMIKAGHELDDLREAGLVQWAGRPVVYELTEAGQSLFESIGEGMAS